MTSWLRGDVSLDDLISRVVGSDEPHDVHDVTASAVSLQEALLDLRARGVERAHAVLPVPGDPHGLSGPPEVNAAAIDAGEAVLTSGVAVALIPDVTVFGPPGDEGHLVSWAVHPANPPRPLLSVSEADRALRAGLQRSSSALGDLDVARWRPEVAEVLVDIRTNRIGEPLPRGFSSAAQALAAQALRLHTVLKVALEDDGSAATLRESDTRRGVLTELSTTTRHALAAATLDLENTRE